MVRAGETVRQMLFSVFRGKYEELVIYKDGMDDRWKHGWEHQLAQLVSAAKEERRPWSDTKAWRGFLQTDAIVAF